MTNTTAQEIALLDGKKALWMYLVLLELATFLSFLSISPSWMGVFDTRFIGAWGSVAIMQAVPFFVPAKYRALLSQTIAENKDRERELLLRIKEMSDVIRDPSKKEV